jgi:hypothetical protein
MPDFAPHRVCAPRHFEIQHDDHGRWIARTDDGLTGGIFLTCREALRFALFEAGGDSAHVYVLGAGESDGRRNTQCPRASGVRADPPAVACTALSASSA